MPVISKPNQHFDASLYTGNLSGTTVVNAGGFQPDVVWFKSRSNVENHQLFDSVRGANNSLYPNLTNGAGLDPGVTSFNSNGFTSNNANGYTYVGWQWKAGGAAVTNTSGSITSQVSVNPTAGFSVVTFTGNGTIGATVGHGLGVAPNMVIVKRRNQASTARWAVQHTSLAANQVIGLNSSNAAGVETAGAGSTFNAVRASSTVITLGDYGDSNASSSTYVAYCWSAVPGYSAFGSFTGNGLVDGPFVYLGFRPAFIMIKRTDGPGSDWFMLDDQRPTFNVIGGGNGGMMAANQTYAESTLSSYAIADFLSNGVKIRSDMNVGYLNASGGNYIYMAFAEAPFKFASAR